MTSLTIQSFEDKQKIFEEQQIEEFVRNFEKFRKERNDSFRREFIILCTQLYQACKHVQKNKDFFTKEVIDSINSDLFFLIPTLDKTFHLTGE